MYNIGILTSCDSERHLSLPIHKELYNIGCVPNPITIDQNNIPASYRTTNNVIHNKKLDFILAVADRPEQMGGVLAAFHNRTLVGHLYAGDHNTIATFDDIHRHAISLYSNIQFCSCEESKNNVISLMNSAGLTPNSYDIGSTHFDGIDMEKVNGINWPSHKYVLILISSETTGNDNQLIKDTISSALKYKDTHHFILLTGNGDSETINDELYNLLKPYQVSMRTKRTDHEHFLSLMMHCNKFISNSSCVIYEAPYLMHKSNIIMIGNRNKSRTIIPHTSHTGKASKKTAYLIKEYLEQKRYQ